MESNGKTSSPLTKNKPNMDILKVKTQHLSVDQNLMKETSQVIEEPVSAGASENKLNDLEGIKLQADENSVSTPAQIMSSPHIKHSNDGSNCSPGKKKVKFVDIELEEDEIDNKDESPTKDEVNQELEGPDQLQNGQSPSSIKK